MSQNFFSILRMRHLSQDEVLEIIANTQDNETNPKNDKNPIGQILLNTVVSSENFDEISDGIDYAIKQLTNARNTIDAHSAF